MDNNSNLIDNLKNLDSVLKYLIDSETYSKHYNSLQSDIFTETLEEVKFDNLDNKTFDELFDDIFSKDIRNQKSLLKLKEAILYLESEGLIRLIEQNHIRITYKGIIQYSKGFIFTYNEERSDKTRLLNVENFQRKTTCWMLWVNGAIALGTLVAMLYYILEILSVHVCYCK